MAGTVLAGQKLTSALLGVPPWSPMTLLNSWVNFGGGYATAQFRKWPLLNEVEIIGVIKSGTITNGTAIATLTGLTPASQQFLNIIVTTTTGGAGGQMPSINVDTSGDLLLENIPSGTSVIAFHAWYSLDA